MERLTILLIWAIGVAIVRSSKNKTNVGETKKGTQNRKNVFSTFMENLEKEMQREREKQGTRGQVQPARSVSPKQTSFFSDVSKANEPAKVKAPPKPVGLEIDSIGGDEEIGGIHETGISKGPQYNTNLNLKKDLLKAVVYSEILSEAKGLKNMKKMMLKQ